MRVRLIDPAGVARQSVEVTACTAVLRDCGVHGWQVSGTGLDVARAGWRVLIPGVCSGPVTSTNAALVDGAVEWTVTGVSETTALADRLTYPVPSAATEDQSAAAYWTATGPAETVIRDLVNVNAGPGAIPARRVAGFQVPASQSRGGQVSISTRWQNLLEEARSLARAGRVTFDAIWEQGGAPLRFRVPRDLSRQVRFGGPRGGLSDVSIGLAAPTATVAVVAGQGEGAARTIKFFGSSDTTWGRRVEAFVDRRDTTDPAEYAKAGAEALADGAASGTASFKVAEVPGLVYGTDYQLGDTVSVTHGGLTVALPVRQVELAWDEYGRTAALTLGDHQQADDKAPAWLGYVQDLDARMRRMEAI